MKPAAGRKPGGAAAGHTAGFARRFLPVWGVGLVGVASLSMQPPPASLLDTAPALGELSDTVIRIVLLANPSILVTAMAAAGAAFAHRVGLRSALAGDAGARPDARTAVIVGMTVALALMAIDAAVAGALGPEWKKVVAQANASPWLPTLLLGVLYGGLAEEVVMRWGSMSLVVWGASRLLRRRSGKADGPRAVATWIGITVAAVIFAVGHLPALAQSVELSGPIVARTLGLNLLAGIAYGWLFWRRSLETAMLAHAATHLGFALGRWLV